ncbi:hypothetical protein [Streptomyces sp. NPDC059611]|uniref:hypothetical protein n=1 Tax=Streptomyces sp. NPDC059611 TaxID=3346884 RepID=UPI0036C8FE66
MPSRCWAPPAPYDLPRTLRVLRRGRSDPACLQEADGTWWRTSRTTKGPVTLRITDHPDATTGRLITGTAWGPGDDWALEQLPALLGADDDTQDSSEYGRIIVPGDATLCGTRIVVCLSEFGSVALVCADDPGAFLGTDEAQTEGELDGADLAKANRVLVELGYVVVAEELLESDYDGPSRLPWHVQRPSWSDRFFGIF